MAVECTIGVNIPDIPPPLLIGAFAFCLNDIFKRSGYMIASHAPTTANIIDAVVRKASNNGHCSAKGTSAPCQNATATMTNENKKAQLHIMIRTYNPRL